jgi:FkbM family methyltransferase
VSLRGSVKKWLYGKCPGFAGSFPYFGTRVYFPKGSLIFEGACEQGIWERELVGILTALARPKTTYFDIGANIGLTSIPVLSNCPDCKVVSFEPSPSTHPFLDRTARNSKYGERWQVIGKAVGNEVGTAEFFTAASELSIFDSMRDTKRAGAMQTLTVPVTTLDAEWAALNHPEVSIIKVDIEGAELLALQGGREFISKQRPYILFEWNPINLKAYDCDPASVFCLSESLGYRLFSLPNLVPVNDPTELRLQMLLTESFLMVPNQDDGR